MLASASLLFSSVALITAANISTGDEGVVRMSSLRPQDGPAPTPTPEAEGTVRVPPAAGATAAAPMPYPQPQSYAPYFERTLGATEMLPGAAYGPEAPFGPILMFESNFGSGLGYKEGYQRANARVPKHIDVNKTVLMGDVSASVTWDGLPIFSAGGIFRTYDSDRNRIYGFNGFFDYDKGSGTDGWTRGTVGTESLGKYLDARLNAYMIAGDNSQLMSSSLLPGIQMMANSVYQTRVDVRNNAYSGGDFGIGGPLPLLGR
ncbi:MAG: inverse autotransporter beta domain-containing protein, partial [Planctomycetaceae bacterium]